MKTSSRFILVGASITAHLYFIYALVQSIQDPNSQAGERDNKEHQIRMQQASRMPQTPVKSQSVIAEPTRSQPLSQKKTMAAASLVQRVPRSVALDIYFQRKKVRGALSSHYFDADEIALMESLYPELAPGTIFESINRLGKATSLLRSNQANYVVSPLGDAAIFAPPSEQVAQLETHCDRILDGLPVTLANFLKGNIIKPLLPSQSLALTYRIDFSQSERRLIVEWGQDKFNTDANVFLKDNVDLHSVAALYK